ncbi:hypothetical protein Tco_0549174 [Tanacetum coccineum]
MGGQTRPRNYQNTLDLSKWPLSKGPLALGSCIRTVYTSALLMTSTIIKRTTSRDIRSSSSKDGLAALVNKLDNLGRDMKKLKERPPGYYTKIDNRPPYGEKRQSLEELLAKHQEESARRSTEMEVWIKKLQENTDINIRTKMRYLSINLETP